MTTIPLTIANPGTFTYTEGQTLYNEKLAFEILKHAANMAAEGYELTFEMFDDLNDAWSQQNTTLTQQTALLSALNNSETLSAEWKSRLASASAQATSLSALDQTPQNFDARNTAIHIFEALFNSVATSALAADTSTGSDTDLLDILKAALLEEAAPGSGIYLTSTVGELKASRTQLEAMQEQLETYQENLETLIQAVQDLQYNDEILEIPATPRPIRISLRSKTIQQ